MSWKTLEKQNPELAAFGTARLHGQVAYLATVRKDGSPRVHPLTQSLGKGICLCLWSQPHPKATTCAGMGVTRCIVG